MTVLRRKAVALAAMAPLVLVFSGCATHTERRSIAATVVGGTAGYSPGSVTVQKENRVIVRVGNGTDREHGFSIEGYKIRRVVQPNESIELRFRAGRGGTFRIYCQLHPAHQPATLVVQ